MPAKAEQVVAKQEREREVGSSLFGGGSRSRSVASVGTTEAVVMVKPEYCRPPTQEIPPLHDSTMPGHMASDGNNMQIEGGEKPPTKKPVKESILPLHFAH
jgi:hypothetical protein